MCSSYLDSCPERLAFRIEYTDNNNNNISNIAQTSTTPKVAIIVQDLQRLPHMYRDLDAYNERARGIIMRVMLFICEIVSSSLSLSFPDAQGRPNPASTLT